MIKKGLEAMYICLIVGSFQHRRNGVDTPTTPVTALLWSTAAGESTDILCSLSTQTGCSLVSEPSQSLGEQQLHQR